MWPLLRTVKVLLSAWWGKPLQPLDQSVIRMRVWPNDIDTNLHLNNGRFLVLMDLARLDLAVRCGLGRLVMKHRWQPLVASVHVRYFRPIPPWARFELRTRLAGWDHKWLVLEQVFMVGEHVMARALVKAVVRSHRGLVSPQDLGRLLKTGLESPLDSEQLAHLWSMEK